MVCLVTGATGERVGLAAEGFGNRHCFLENIADKVITITFSEHSFADRKCIAIYHNAIPIMYHLYM